MSSETHCIFPYIVSTRSRFEARTRLQTLSKERLHHRVSRYN